MPQYRLDQSAMKKKLLKDKVDELREKEKVLGNVPFMSFLEQQLLAKPETGSGADD